LKKPFLAATITRSGPGGTSRVKLPSTAVVVRFGVAWSETIAPSIGIDVV